MKTDKFINLIYKYRATFFFTIAFILIMYLEKSDIPYKWCHLYFNYEHGFLKRGLIGELFKVLHIRQDLFTFNVFSVLMLVGVATIYYKLIKDKKPSVFLGFALIFLCSPLLLKNLIFDWGRYDQIVLAFIFSQLLYVGKPIPSRIILYASPILLFIHEGTILWAFPIILSIAYFENRSELFKVVPILIICLLVLQKWGGLDIDDKLYEQQLHEWAAPEAVYGVAIYSVSANINDAISAALYVLPKNILNSHGIRGIVLVVSLLIPLFFIQSRLLKLFALLSILSSTILYFVAVDHYRWMSLQGIICLCFLLYAHNKEMISNPKVLFYYLLILSGISLFLEPIGIWQ